MYLGCTGHSIIIYREGLDLTLFNPSLSTGKDYPVHSLMMNRMAVLWSRVSGNLLGIGDGFPNTSLVLMEHGYNLLVLLILQICAAY